MTNSWVGTNERWWDERAAHHARSQFYDLDGFRAGRNDLRPFELAELGVDPRDRDLVHLQCHLGTDTLSWARLGARVSGVDFSAPAIEAARRLAKECELDAEFVVADVYDSLGALGGRTFDIVYTGIGALSWLPDLQRWGSVVSSLLRPGGVAYIVEIHPFLWTYDVESGREFDYFDAITSDDAAGSYTDRSLPTVNNVVVERNPGFAPVLNALIAAGLTIELVGEHAIGVEQYRPELVQGPDRLWRVPDGAPKFPMLWSVRARR
jgi:SAM-dependent methyltransferase